MKSLLIALLMILLPIALWAQHITAAEYFIDEDAGFGKNTLIPVPQSSNELSLDFEVEFTDLSAGIHSLGVRVRDENGRWSLTTNRIFLVDYETLSPTGIVAAEYFIDEDAGFGKNKKIDVSGGATVDTLTFEADLSSYEAGIHMLYVRAKDVNGKWSLVSQRAFIVSDEEAPATIVALKYYYYDVEEEKIAGAKEYTYSLPEPKSMVDLNFQATTAPLENQKWYNIYIWAVDSKSRASLVSTQNFQYIETTPIVIEEISANNVVCASEQNGMATIKASGGTGELRYSISRDSAAYQSSNRFEGLAPGTYTAYVRGNLENYVESKSFSISSPEPLLLSTSEVKDVNCASDANGSITLSASGGSGSVYEYSLDGTTFQTSNVFENLVAGIYAVTVKDSIGCTQVLANIEIKASQSTPSTPSIYRSDDSELVDELELIAEGTTPSASLQWYRNGNPISGASSSRLTITEPGTYTVVASNGSCVSLPSNEISITGLAEDLAEQLKLYPVPASRHLKLEVPSRLLKGAVSVQLINSSGQLIASSEITNTGSLLHTEFDIHSLPVGLYFLLVKGEEMIIKKKFSKH